ncbi:MAG: diphthamide synthesis protein [Candidatus Pacearchaeota archaeon]
MTQIIFVEAKWEGQIKLEKKLENYIKKNKIKSIALFTSVQFSDIENFISEIKSKEIKVNITKAKRTSNKMQILGCDIYHDSFETQILDESDAILYVGDGYFHPKALLLAQIKNKKIKPVMMWNPISKTLQVLNEGLIREQIKKYKRNLKLFISADTIGILVTIKPGQNYFMTAKRLKEFLENQGKKAYIFIDNNIDLRQLENYTFIKAWVNTACPRIGTDDIVNIKQPLINIKEATNPIKALEELEFRE